jgi:hypothetical protein
MNNDIIVDRIVNLLRGRRLNYKEWHRIRMELELCTDLPYKYKEKNLKEDFILEKEMEL